jgi:hypothetical protein
VCPLLVPVCVCVWAVGSEEEEDEEEEVGVVGRGSVCVCVCVFVLEEEGTVVDGVWVGMTIFCGRVCVVFGLISLLWCVLGGEAGL